MAEQDLDRNETATPFKLEKARERGQAAKSTDVVSAVVFAVAVVFFAWRGEALLQEQFFFDRALLIEASRFEPTGASLWPLIKHMLVATVQLMTPFFIALMLAAIIANMAQTGPMLSAEPVKMDWNRINPTNGLKRVFSMRTLFDAARACIKLALLGVAAYWSLSALLPQFYGLASLTSQGFIKTLLADLAKLGFQMALILGVLAILDFIFTKREFAKKMRMSRRELKDEFKHREGDPRIRARMREIRREMLKKSLALKKTKGADVLITNPTHIAIALKYEPSGMSSPQLVAKGSGKMAAAMREIAAKHGIPVVHNPPLARRMYREMQVEQFVPSAIYAEVARIIVWVFAMRERRMARAGGAV